MAIDYEANPLGLIIDIERNGFDTANADHVAGVQFLVDTKIIEGLADPRWRELDQLFRATGGCCPRLH